MHFSDKGAVVLGFLLGMMAKPIFDYLCLLRENPSLVFDRRFWITLAASVGLSFILGLASYVGFFPTPQEGDRVNLFLASFAIGFTVNRIFNKKKRREILM